MSILLNNKQITDLRKIRPIIRDQNNNRNLSKRQGTSNLNISSNADEISNEDCSNIPDSTNHHNGQSVIPKLIFAENKIPKLKIFSNVSNICINESLSKANTYLNTINEKLSKQSDLNFHIQKEELRFQTHQPIISPGAINVNVNVNNINIINDSNPGSPGNTPRENLSTHSFFKNVYPQCLICSRIYPCCEIISTSNCQHGFCATCLRDYLEMIMGKGENDINSIKCPIFSCSNFFPRNVIRNYLPYIYSEYSGKGKLSPVQFALEDLSELRKFNKKEIYSKYSKKHVIDLNSNKNFFLFTKSKIEICPKCQKNTLFLKKGNKFFICLNCLNKFCKFCKSPYSEPHLQKNNTERCRIYYRFTDDEIRFREYRNKKKYKHCLFLFLLSICQIIAGYIIILGGLCSYVRDWVNGIVFKHKEKRSTIKTFFLNFLRIILIFIITTFILPIVLICIPYFPLLASI